LDTITATITIVYWRIERALHSRPSIGVDSVYWRIERALRSRPSIEVGSEPSTFRSAPSFLFRHSSLSCPIYFFMIFPFVSDSIFSAFIFIYFPKFSRFHFI